MRKAIITKLNAVLPTVGHYQGDMVTKETTKPYTVLRKSNEIGSNINGAYKTYFNVFCNVDQTNYINLDSLVRNVISALNNVRLTTDDAINFYLVYNGFIGNEFYDEDFNTFSQGLLFSTNNLII